MASFDQSTGYELQVEQDLLTSRIVALFLESAFFGVFVVTYFHGLGKFLGEGNPNTLSKRTRALLLANTVIFLLAVVHVSFTVKLTINGFVTNGTDIDSVYNALVAARDFDNPFSYTQFYIYVTQTLIGDAFMVYRLFVVWRGSWRVIVAPIILFLADAVSGYASGPLSAIGVPIFFCLSLFTNTLCTILIMWRLLRSDGHVHADRMLQSRAWFNLITYRRFLEVIVESAAIYSTASLALVVTCFISPNVGFGACLSVFPQIIGVTFSLIVIQIACSTAATNDLHDLQTNVAPKERQKFDLLTVNDLEPTL